MAVPAEDGSSALCRAPHKAEEFASAIRQVSEWSRRLNGAYAGWATGSSWPVSAVRVQAVKQRFRRRHCRLL